MPPLRIGFDALTVTARPGGVGRATRGFLLGLAALPGDHEIVAVRALDALLPEALRRTTWLRAPVAIPDTPRALFYQHATMPRALRAAGVDVHVGPAFVLPLRSPGVPEVVVIHDAAWRRFPETKSARFRAYMDAVVPRSMRRAAAVVTNSAFTAQECGVLAPDLARERIRVIPLGVDPRGAGTARPAPIPGEYLLAVSNFDPRKNLARLVEAWRRARAAGLPHALVLVGDPERARELRATVGAGEDEPLHTPGYVDDDTLAALYAGASAVVVPSLYEGFGFPVIEAFAAGVPVACANAGSLPETAAGEAILFDPLDVVAMSAALREVVTPRPDADERRAAARAIAASATWERAATELLNVLGGIAGR